MFNFYVDYFSVVPNAGPAIESPKRKKRKLSGSTQDTGDTSHHPTDTESEPDEKTPRKTRSKAKESPVAESKTGKEKRQSVGASHHKAKGKTDEVDSSGEMDTEIVDKTIDKSVDKSVDKKTKEKQRENIELDELSHTHFRAESKGKGGKARTKSGKFAAKGTSRTGKSKCKNNEDADDWADKRPTPSMDYNESNAKCPLPGCDSKGKAHQLLEKSGF